MGRDNMIARAQEEARGQFFCSVGLEAGTEFATQTVTSVHNLGSFSDLPFGHLTLDGRGDGSNAVVMIELLGKVVCDVVGTGKGGGVAGGGEVFGTAPIATTAHVPGTVEQENSLAAQTGEG